LRLWRDLRCEEYDIQFSALNIPPQKKPSLPRKR
jgi:hypothetical protein